MSNQATEFLLNLRPTGPWVVHSLPVEGGVPKTHTFLNIPDVEKWLLSHASENLYYSVNPTIGPVTKKPERIDHKSVEYLHVDIDPRIGEPLETEQPRILSLLSGFQPKPTCIIFSGGGYQGLWKLAEPIPIEGSLEKAEAAALYNATLEIALGGDACRNIDRILRLPGTTNWPNAKKQAKGRVVTPTATIYFDDHLVYPLSAFKQASPPTAKTVVTEKSLDIGDTVQRVDSVDSLPIKDWLKVLIVQGCDPDNPSRHKSRSQTLWVAVNEMLRCGMKDETIYAIITDPGFGISSSVLDKGNAAAIDRYARRQISRSKESMDCEPLSRLNAKYAVVGSIEGKCRVLCEEFDPAFNRTKLTFQTFDDFRNRFLSEKIQCGEDKNGAPKYVPLGHWWLEQARRRYYDGVAFCPGGDVEGVYNTFRGFGVTPQAGDCSLFLDHAKHVICAGNTAHYTYLLNWMASCVQHPESPGQVSIVLRGGKGTGKGFFVKNFGKLFGQHFLPVTDAKHLVGSFNAHLATCILLFADEAVYAGDKSGAEVLKALITEDSIMVERKFFDAALGRNYLHIMMASNNDWVVPASGDERRFFVLDVADSHRQDFAYFEAIQQQMDNGGYEALLHYLKNLDIAVNIRQAPASTALSDQKELSMRPEECWWYDRLHEGVLLSTLDEWPKMVQKTAIYADYASFVDTHSNHKAKTSIVSFYKFLRRVLPLGYPVEHRRTIAGGGYAAFGDTERPWVLEFPPLDVCREQWDKVYKNKEPTVWQYMAKPEKPEQEESLYET